MSDDGHAGDKIRPMEAGGEPGVTGDPIVELASGVGSGTITNRRVGNGTPDFELVMIGPPYGSNSEFSSTHISLIV